MTTGVKSSVKTATARPIRSISVADAKAQFSALITRVESRRLPITILRRGVPVAQIMPVDRENLESGYGWMRGTVHELGDIVGPTGEEWTASDE